MLTLVAYLCRNGSNGHGSGGSDKVRAATQGLSDAIIGSNNFGQQLCGPSMQTEMFLVGGLNDVEGGGVELERSLASAAIYHNIPTNNDQQRSLFTSEEASENAFSEASRACSQQIEEQKRLAGGFDLLIIDSSGSNAGLHEANSRPELANHVSLDNALVGRGQAQAILLIESPDSHTTATTTTTTNTSCLGFNLNASVATNKSNNYQRELVDDDPLDHTCQGRLQRGQAYGSSNSLCRACTSAHEQCAPLRLAHPSPSETGQLSDEGALFCDPSECGESQMNLERRLLQEGADTSNLRHFASSSSLRPTSGCGVGCGEQLDARNNSTRRKSRLSGNPLQTTSFFIEPTDHYGHLVGSSAASALTSCYNFELNSQGELTMTDESSSLFHEEHSCGRVPLQVAGVGVCCQCQMLASLQVDSNQVEQNSTRCDECLKSSITSPSGESETLKSDSSSERTPSTLKRITNTRMNVRFNNNY